MTYKKMTADQTPELLRQLRQGSYRAFSRVYHIYVDALYSFALAQTRSRTIAQDVVQDTFLSLWDSRRNIDEQGNVQAYLFMIARHKMVDIFRRQVKQVDYDGYMELHPQTSSLTTPEEYVNLEEFKYSVNRVKSLLSPREREIYELSREYGLTVKQISEKLGISQQTVKNYITSGLKTMRSKLSKVIVLMILLTSY